MLPAYKTSRIPGQLRPARRAIRGVLCVLCVFCSSTPWLLLPAPVRAQDAPRVPHIGYLYPAGAQAGAAAQITVGGQNLRGVTDAHVTGEGVHAKVIRFYTPIRNIQKEQRDELLGRIKAVRDERLSERPGGDRVAAALDRRNDKERAEKRENRDSRAEAGKSSAPAKPADAKSNDASQTKTADKPAYKPIEHPLLENLEDKSLRELANIAHILFFPREKRQMNAQIGEMVLVEITIDADAAPGDRELRLLTPSGLTNPMVFQVGQFPEVVELEPNDPNGDNRLMAANADAYKRLPDAPPLDLPVLVNGQIMPGDVDRFRFRATEGQRLVVQTAARHLVPYLADAVPGWFQATVALYDANGKELAFDDDYRFNPDPVLFYEVPKDGEYELEIRDSIYRGREDFVYRVAVGEQPFVTGMFPLGAHAGTEATAWIAGWNLTAQKIELDTRDGGDAIRQATFREGRWVANPIPYAVDTLPESEEAEPNDDAKSAQTIAAPRIVNGFIAKPGDVDVFKFKGKSGDALVAEVEARRLNSPLDSLLRLTDASGRVLAWNDDHEDKSTDLLTHHADSRLTAQLPKDGTYFVQVCDAQRQGGTVYGYRLRIGPPRPDFALRVVPSSLNVAAGQSVPVTVFALRKDGFKGEIDLALSGAPAGFALSGARIPANGVSVRMTLRAPAKPLDRLIHLKIEGSAAIDGRKVTRPAVPAEDMMQAFAYRHLVPSQELLVAVPRPRRPTPLVELADSGPVRIPMGGTARVRVKTPPRMPPGEIQLQFSEAPDGLTIGDVDIQRESMTFEVVADDDMGGSDLAGNLIVEAFMKPKATQPAAKASATAAPATVPNTPAAKAPQRVFLGVLPAIPFEVVQQ